MKICLIPNKYSDLDYCYQCVWLRKVVHSQCKYQNKTIAIGTSQVYDYYCYISGNYDSSENNHGNTDLVFKVTVVDKNVMTEMLTL